MFSPEEDERAFQLKEPSSDWSRPKLQNGPIKTKETKEPKLKRKSRLVKYTFPINSVELNPSLLINKTYVTVKNLNKF